VASDEGSVDTAIPLTTAAAPRRSIVNVLIVAAAVVIVLAGLKAAASLVSLLVLSIIVTLLLAPIQARLTARGQRLGVALLLCLALYLVAMLIAGGLLLVGLADFARNLTTYEDALRAAVDRALGSPELVTTVSAAVATFADTLVDSLTNAVATIAYSVIVVAYLLLEAPRAKQRLLWAFNGNREIVSRATTTAIRLRDYIVARAVLGFVAAVLDTIALVILGVPSALLWGILSFLLSFVPNIGFILALIPPTLLALVINGLPSAIAVVIAYCVINVAIDYVIQPRYVGSTVHLSAVVVTVTIVFWTIVLGPAGAILAVPMTIVAAAIADYFDDSRPFARMIDDSIGDPQV